MFLASCKIHEHHDAGLERDEEIEFLWMPEGLLQDELCFLVQTSRKLNKNADFKVEQNQCV
jgi:hypothetical protein